MVILVLVHLLLNTCSVLVVDYAPYTPWVRRGNAIISSLIRIGPLMGGPHVECRIKEMQLSLVASHDCFKSAYVPLLGGQN